MAKSKTMIDNEKTRVTMWSFEVGDQTGQHVHEYDYVIVPMLDGELKIINEDDSISKIEDDSEIVEVKNNLDLEESKEILEDLIDQIIQGTNLTKYAPGLSYEHCDI